MKLEDELKPEKFKALTKDQKSFLQGVLDFEEAHGNETVMADQYQLGRVDGNNFSLDVKKIRRQNMPISADEVIKYNWNYLTTGKIYIFKPEETKIMHEERLAHRAELAKKEELRRASGEAFTDAMQTISNTAAAKVASKIVSPTKDELEEKKPVASKTLVTAEEEIKNYFATEEGQKFESVEQLNDMYITNEKFKAFIDSKVGEANA